MRVKPGKKNSRIDACPCAVGPNWNGELMVSPAIVERIGSTAAPWERIIIEIIVRCAGGYREW